MAALPPLFLQYISQWPQLAPLASDLLTAPEVSIRANQAKNYMPVQAASQVPWCQQGWYLAERPQFTFDPAMHQGRYYVQDASSMAIDSVMRELADSLGGAPVRYLDSCAAPGGKTTAAIAALPKGSLVVANEYDFRRAEILAENLAKWGSPHVVATRGDTSRLRKLADFFDIVAVDAPCSGEGMMRKDPQAVAQWSPALVESCAQTQRQILANAWGSLRPGGYLVYSTCTFNRKENEENLQWMVDEFGAEPIAVAALEQFSLIEHGIDTDLPCYRFLPGRVKGEGLFLCVMKKPGHREHRNTKLRKTSGPVTPQIEKQVENWLDLDMEWRLISMVDTVYALPATTADDMCAVVAALDAILAGVEIGVVKGKDLLPSQGLALSTALHSEAFPRVEVDYATAIAYLQRQAVSVDAPKGYVLLCYQDSPLGFIKNLGNRSNNLYPKNWRIVSRF